ncbi:MAG: hypothetical protein RLZZ444_1080 [Pseudomonadota bacterium]|jgi:chromosome segregation ATPase
MKLPEFLKGRKPTEKLSALNDKIAKWRAEKASRDERRQALLTRLDAIKLDAATGDPDAKREFTEIHTTLAGLVFEDESAADAFAQLESGVSEAKAEIATETEAANRAAQIKAAKAGLKRIPTIFSELKELEARRAALHAELASIEPATKPSADLDAWQADKTAWLEWRAGIRERNPEEQTAYDRDQERLEDYRRRKAEMAWQTSPKRAALDDERYERAGWQVHKAPEIRYNSETRQWE